MDTQILDDPSGDQIAMAVATMKLLADETRLQLVWALLHGEHAVGELAEHIGARSANVSQHLAKLRLARLVRVRRDGNRILYLIENAHVRRLLEEALFHANHVRHELPDHPTPEHPGHIDIRR